MQLNEKIPNNVDLGSDKRLQRALEHWQPSFQSWWNDMGREGFDPQFVNMVDGLIKDQPYSTHYERILALE